MSVVLASCGSGDDLASADGDNSDTTEAVEPETGDIDESTTTTATEEPETTTTTEAAPILIPDLLGLTESQARAQLAELGLAEPTVTLKESLEAPGTVLEQVPRGGVEARGGVSIVVAEAIAPMPDFVGGPIAAARNWADDRGITLRTESLLTTEVAGGSVVDQIPIPGGEVGSEILITVAETPRVLLLADLATAAQDQYEMTDLEMNGALFPNTPSFALQVGRCCDSDTGYADFNLSRDWTSLELVLGIDDRHSISSTVVVEFQLDGQVVLTETATFGTTVPVKLDVTDVLRLRIVAKAVSGGRDVALGLGNAQLIGGSNPAETSNDG